MTIYSYELKDGPDYLDDKFKYSMYYVTKGAPYKFHVTVNLHGTNEINYYRDHITFDEDYDYGKWFFLWIPRAKKYIATNARGRDKRLLGKDLIVFNNVVKDMKEIGEKLNGIN